MNTAQNSVHPKEPMSHIGTIATIIASMAAVLIALVTNARTYLDPLAFNLLVGALAVAILGLAGYYLVILPLLPRISTWRRDAQQESTAMGILPDLVDIVDRFREVSFTTYATSIHRAIELFAEQQPIPSLRFSETHLREQHLMRVLSDRYYTVMEEPVSQLLSDARNRPRPEGSRLLLSHFAAEFSNLLRVHKLLFMESYVEACRKARIENVSRASTGAYAKFLTKYNQFVPFYIEFAKKTNRQMGRRLFADYLENAEPLEA